MTFNNLEPQSSFVHTPPTQIELESQSNSNSIDSLLESSYSSTMQTGTSNNNQIENNSDQTEERSNYENPTESNLICNTEPVSASRNIEVCPIPIHDNKVPTPVDSHRRSPDKETNTAQNNYSKSLSGEIVSTPTNVNQVQDTDSALIANMEENDTFELSDDSNGTVIYEIKDEAPDANEDSSFLDYTAKIKTENFEKPNCTGTESDNDQKQQNLADVDKKIGEVDVKNEHKASSIENVRSCEVSKKSLPSQSVDTQILESVEIGKLFI